MNHARAKKLLIQIGRKLERFFILDKILVFMSQSVSHRTYPLRFRKEALVNKNTRLITEAFFLN